MASSDTNTPEFSVSELANTLKRTIEDSFGHVRVRGELGRVTIARSGHAYLDLKDEKAVIDGVMWKGLVSRLNFKPEEGLEVICEGKLTTYPGRSKYQIIIERMEPAGAGALMALLEERKKKLANEGLFEASRKRPIPYLPQVIGVITSPTGAVIRDILHRLEDRFPRHVLLWPVLVQGEGAAAQIAAAIEGFNTIDGGSAVPRPDVLIVARGGGSVEDLWSFNEENVVRAAAASEIPLISAVGHETDTTLIDFASDRRAPTPTGAAEMAVPVRSELMQVIRSQGERITRSLMRLTEIRRSGFRATARAFPAPQVLFGPLRQRLDLAAAGIRTDALRRDTRNKAALLTGLADRLGKALLRRGRAGQDQLTAISKRLTRATPIRIVQRRREALARFDQQFVSNARRSLEIRKRQLAALSAQHDLLGHASVLRRGFALVRDARGGLIQFTKQMVAGDQITIELADGHTPAQVEAASPQKRRKSRTSVGQTSDKQGQLF